MKPAPDLSTYDRIKLIIKCLHDCHQPATKTAVDEQFYRETGRHLTIEPEEPDE